MERLDPVPTRETEAEADSDPRLVARVLAGDGGAFEAVMRKNNQRLFRMTRALLGDDAEAEDAMQQAYLAAFTHMGSFAGESSLSAWLMRIARNEALSRLRKRKRLSESRLDDDHDEGVAMHTRAPDKSGRSPEDLAALRQLAVLVERAIDALPEIYRVFFVLREVEQLSTEETAASLELTEALVKVRLHRARQQLKRALLDDLEAQTPHAFVFLGERCDRVVARVLSRLDVRG